MTKTPVYCVGGKARLAATIVSHFPADYTLYCEPFGGSAAVLLATEHDPLDVREVYNDVDRNLVNFMYVVRTQPDDLYSQCFMTLWSRDVVRKWRAEILDPDGSGWWGLPPLERAVRWWLLNRQCFSGWISRENAGWSHRTKADGNWHPATYRSAMSRFVPFAQRLAQVQVESLPWERIVEKYGQEGALLYVDPPYFGTRFYQERANEYYSEPWTREADLALAGALMTTPAKVVYSNYDRPEVDLMFSGWHKVVLEDRHVSSANPKGGTKRATEVLMCNF